MSITVTLQPVPRQTFDDALGEADALRVRTTAAHNAFRELRSAAVFTKSFSITPAERIILASDCSLMGKASCR